VTPRETFDTHGWNQRCGGRLIISPVAHAESLRRMGVESEQPVNVGTFGQGQRAFLNYQRNSVLLQAQR
jgi:putative restriction endonuclease